MKYLIYEEVELKAAFSKKEDAEDYVCYLNTIGVTNVEIKKESSSLEAINESYEAVRRNIDLSNKAKEVRYSELMTQLENEYGWKKTLLAESSVTNLYFIIMAARERIRDGKQI